MTWSPWILRSKRLKRALDADRPITTCWFGHGGHSIAALWPGPQWVQIHACGSEYACQLALREMHAWLKEREES